MVLKNIIGEKYGRLLVVSRAENNASGYVYWLCLCDCGKEKIISRSSLRHGSVKSCGCLNTEIVVARNTKHGAAARGKQTSEYSAWMKMKERCLNPKARAYENYGGRGIKVCPEWLNSFNQFIQDMGPKPNGFSIERRDVNGDYNAQNCCWIPLFDQGANKRNSAKVEFGGIVMHKAAWIRFLGIKAYQFYAMENKGFTMRKIVEKYKPLLAANPIPVFMPVGQPKA